MHTLCLGTILILIACLTSEVDAVEKTRPNVLFISIDDLNDWVGFMDGHPQAKTPYMNALASFLAFIPIGSKPI